MNEQCVICGSISVYTNYNVVACNACKQFFRRVVVTQRMYQCGKEESCDMNTTKIKCRGCRLDRCLVAGMDCALVEVVVTPEAKAFRQLLEQRRRKATDRVQQQASLPKISLNGDDLCPTLAHLQVVEDRSRHFLKAHLAFRAGFLEQFGSLKELLAFGENIVCTFDKFTTHFKLTPIELSATAIPTRPILAVKESPFVTELVEAFEFFRSAPIVVRLDAADQISLLRYVGLPLHKMNLFYRSYLVNSDVSVNHSGGVPLLFLRKHLRYCQDRVVQDLSARVFGKSMVPFNRAQLGQEEYLLLRSIVVAHPAAPELSRRAQLVLQEESERLAAILMKRLRRERGDLEAMKRYAELIHLVEVVFQISAKARELIAYLVIITDREYSTNFPNALIQMCF